MYTQFLQKIILPIGDRVFGSNLSRDIERVKLTLAQSSYNIQRKQSEDLFKHLNHVKNHSVYYKQLKID